MSDETTPLILGDAVAGELNRPPRRRGGRGRRAPKPPLTHCENCGSSLVGPYCAQCGQPAIDYRRSFASLLADAADAFFNFDARFFQSFGLLLFKPWRLTNEFIEGKRARHVHPLRVYLIASVIFFLVINFLSRGAQVNRESLHKKGAHLDLGPSRTDLSSMLGPDIALNISPNKPPGVSPGISFSTSPNVSPTAAPSPGTKIMFEDLDKQKDMPPFAKWVEGRAKEKLGPTGDRIELFIKALISNLAPMVLCCIPLFALVLKILYIFKRRFYIDHLIFALHTHAFVFLSTVVIIGLSFLLRWTLPFAFTPIVCTFLGIAVLVQLLIAIRRVYGQNWFATIFKFSLGSLIYTVLLSIAFALTAALTLLLP